MDVQGKVTIRQSIYPDGVIEIARRLAIDGDDVIVPKVSALSQHVGGDVVGESLRLSDHLRGKPMRQMVLPNDDFDVDAKIIRPAENFDHAAHAVFAIGGELNHLDVDDEPL